MRAASPDKIFSLFLHITHRFCWRRNVGFSIVQYERLRPTLWHLTHSQNFDSIRKSRVLMSAEHLTSTTPDGPRHGRQIIPVIPVLRDQDLLHEQCIAFEPGSSMADFLRELHRRVFFWSGWPDKPIKPGRHAIDRYGESDILIRLPFREVAKDHVPYFSRCNSGATRMQQGKPVPRGPGTFVKAPQCDFRPSKVVEVTFVQPVRLPPGTEVARFLCGPWEIL